MKIVIDTNVFVSALLLPNSKAKQLLEICAKEHQILVSKELIYELQKTLSNKKFDKYISEQDKLNFLKALIPITTEVFCIKKVAACRDAKDDMILEIAINADADIIISGDKDLLVLNPFHKVKILSPAEFLNL